MKKEWLVKTLALSIVVLFICMNVNPSIAVDNVKKTSKSFSNGNILYVDGSGPGNCSMIQDAVGTPKKLSVRGHVAYGWVVYSSLYKLGPCYFDVTKPETIIKLADTLIPNFLSGGTWTNDGRWLCCYYGDGQLWEVNPLNGNIYIIGGGGVNLNGLACNPVNNKLFGAGNTALYAIDMETGAQELIGLFGSDVWYMIGMAFDSSGVLYGWSLNDYLWTINTSTGDATQVGPLGIDLNYAQDGDFDRDNGDILYLASFTISPNYGGYLYTCDKNTAACTLVGAFPGTTEIDAFAIPYRPYADFTWKPRVTDPGYLTIFNASESFDPNGGYIKLYEWDWDNDGIFDENHTIPTTTHIFQELGDHSVKLRVTNNDNLTALRTKKVKVGNQPPNPPIITGPTDARIGMKYGYLFYMVDSEYDAMYLRVDWGDNTSSGWLGPYKSCFSVRLNHTWNQKQTYTIKAQTKDILGHESDWGTLYVNVPRNKLATNALFLRFLERFPNAFPILKYVLGGGVV